MKYLISNNILNDCQHGFRAKRSSETQILTLYHELAAFLDKKIQTDMVILDFSKVFDHVPHRRPLKKVHYGISVDFIFPELQNTAGTGGGPVIRENSSRQRRAQGLRPRSGIIPDLY